MTTMLNVEQRIALALGECLINNAKIGYEYDRVREGMEAAQAVYVEMQDQLSAAKVQVVNMQEQNNHLEMQLASAREQVARADAIAAEAEAKLHAMTTQVRVEHERNVQWPVLRGEGGGGAWVDNTQSVSGTNGDCFNQEGTTFQAIGAGPVNRD